MKLKTIKLKKTGFEITKPIKWTKSCSEIKAPKGFRLTELWELIKIMQTSNYLLDYEKGNWIYFLANQTKDDKKKRIVRGLGRVRGGSWGASWNGDLDGFNESCRVVFIKEKEL